MPEMEYVYVSLTDEELAHPDVFEAAFSAVARANGATRVIARREPGGAMVFGVDLCDLLPSVLPDIAHKMFRRMMAAATTAEAIR